MAAALRLLVEGAPCNAARLAASSPDPFAPLLALELGKLHEPNPNPDPDPDPDPDPSPSPNPNLCR